MVEAVERTGLEARAGRLAELAEQSLRDFDAEALRGNLEERIREHPLVSVLLAASAGFILGRLLRS